MSQGINTSQQPSRHSPWASQGPGRGVPRGIKLALLSTHLYWLCSLRSPPSYSVSPRITSKINHASSHPCLRSASRGTCTLSSPGHPRLSQMDRSALLLHLFFTGTHDTAQPGARTLFLLAFCPRAPQEKAPEGLGRLIKGLSCWLQDSTTFPLAVLDLVFPWALVGYLGQRSSVFLGQGDHTGPPITCSSL